MSIVHETSIRLDVLPGEVQDLIFHWTIAGASREELKAFRLSDRFFKTHVDKILFGTLHISASNLSLQRLRCVASRPSLACYVRELVFHRGTFSGHRMSRMVRGGLSVKDYGDFEEYIVQNRAYAKHLPRVSRAFVNFTDEIYNENEFNRESAWRAFLSRQCQNFPKLDTLTTLNGDQDIAFSTYFDKRCGLQQQSFTTNYFAPYEIMDSMGPTFRPKVLNFDSVNGEDFGAIITLTIGGLDSVHRHFGTLRRLHLTFSETVVSLPTKNSYDYFFQSLDELESLSLGFPTYDSEQSLKDSNSFYQRLLRIVLSQHYARLTSFSVQHALMGEDEYVKFVERHASTIQNLQLHDWTIPLSSAGKECGSIYRTIYRIGQLKLPALRELTWKGNFSNNGVAFYYLDINLPFIRSFNDYVTGETSTVPSALSTAVATDPKVKPKIENFTGPKTELDLACIDLKLIHIVPCSM